MSATKNIIEHPGRIDKIENDKITVTILSQSACSTCHSKSMCTVSEMEEKTIEIKNYEELGYKVGEQITVYMKKSLGTWAVMFGYLFPFLLVIFSLITLILITGKEGLSGLISLGLLLPYYFGLHKLKDKFSRTFEFSIKSFES
ncbi:MAG: SoxR reducing system RseC family protein [Bacteroidetes bacterium]|nr:SoxR reducing system RseC family protein [Bacteroidota bacterium]